MISSSIGDRSPTSSPAVIQIPALLVDHVSKTFVVGRGKVPVEAVVDVSMRLERGDIQGVLGANGSGKSTFVRLSPACSRWTPGGSRSSATTSCTTSGGQAADQPGERRRRLLQEAQPDGEPDFAARVYGLDVASAKVTVYEILERLQVGSDRVDRPIEQMSRGMQQKVAIARALLTSPALLLLDEPTTGLDPRSKLQVQAFVEELRETHDTTIVLTTHDLAEAERLCDRITVIDGGRVVAEDTPEGLVATVAARLGRPATLEDVFMTWTGRSLDDDDVDGDATAETEIDARAGGRAP